LPGKTFDDDSVSAPDLQPILIGNTIKLRPLEAEDLDALYASASDPIIWELHPDSTRYKREVFEQRFFVGALASAGALVIEEKGTGRIIGSSRYYEWNPAVREISIGFTFIEPQYWGMGTNKEFGS
jgi:RimJ/RimL family protein N-acetyltransferase